MGIFDNFVLESFDFLNEGLQADVYKFKKQKEKEYADKATKERNARRYGDDKYGSKYGHKNPEQRRLKRSGDDEKEDFAIERSTSDSRRAQKAADIGNKDYYSGKRARNPEENRTAIDAANRHLRRHSKNESVYDDYE